ncbi:MAG: hypothetical protein JKY37_12065 [Nannocystaceae bacterium]|nr:hypothetical protein [Nannocystaceae bacterium]
MTVHIATDGETVKRIARLHGFLNWRTLWDHPKNAGLRAQRDSPNTLVPGDEIFVPEHKTRTEACATGTHHAFVAPRERTTLELRLMVDDNSSLAGWAFTLRIGGTEVSGIVPESGLIRHDVPDDLEEAILHVVPPGEGSDSPEALTSRLKIGFLHAPSTESGALSRLHNLGYYDLAADEPVDKPLADAGFSRFQTDKQIADGPTAETHTRTTLAAEHGC